MPGISELDQQHCGVGPSGAPSCQCALCVMAMVIVDLSTPPPQEGRGEDSGVCGPSQNLS